MTLLIGYLTKWKLKQNILAGEKALQKLFINKLKYPKKARKNKTEGSVIIQYVIDTSGNIIEAKIRKGLTDEMNREALRLIYSQKQWIPATQNGRKVKAYRKRTIVFALKKQR